MSTPCCTRDVLWVVEEKSDAGCWCFFDAHEARQTARDEISNLRAIGTFRIVRYYREKE